MSYIYVHTFSIISNQQGALQVDEFEKKLDDIEREVETETET